MKKLRAFFGVPTHFHAIFGLEQSFLDEHRSETLHTIISNAAPLPQVMKEKICGHFGTILHETYGSTEGGFVSNLRPADQLRKIACVGQPFPATRVEIRRPDGSECDAEEVGELYVSSSCLFNGYWKLPDETADAFQDGGWVTVGDLAKKDAEGHLYIVDRIKDMVISGGINIYPREIEEVLVTHPLIREAAVIGVPDEKWGERLKAFVVGPQPDMDPDEIIAFCEGKISAMKTPKEYVVIEALPRNASGKVLKTDLRSLA